MGTNRLGLIAVAGVAALIVVAVTVAVTVLVVGGDGDGGGPAGEPGGEVAQNPEPEEPPDVAGEWVVTAPIDTSSDEYEEGDPETFVLEMTIQRDNSGALVGEGYGEYGDEGYEVEISQPEEVGGATSFEVYDAAEGMQVSFDDETESPGELAGYAEGWLGGFEPDIEGEFVAERR